MDVSSATGNGGVFDSLRTVSVDTTTSTSPVSSLALAVSAERRRTVPCTPMTNSDRSRLALAIACWSSLSNTTCVTPPRSRTSMNSSPPRSRTRWTHPSRVTLAPTSEERNAPQVWVRVSCPSGSATLCQFLANRLACVCLGVDLLALCLQVLHGQRPLLDLVAAHDGDIGDASRISVLDLLADLVGIGIDQHAQSGLAQQGRDPHGMRRVCGVEDRHHHVGRGGRQRRREHAPLA